MVQLLVEKKKKRERENGDHKVQRLIMENRSDRSHMIDNVDASMPV